MRNILSIILIVAGMFFLTVSLYQIYQHKAGTTKALEKAEQLVSQKKDQPNSRSQFSPKENDVIGVLHIPKIEGLLPIVEGTDEEMLEKGVGHYSDTVFPGDKEQILLSGHRDTVFRNFGELEVGDRFIVEMPYGKFEYEMKESEIVSADDRTVIGAKGEEVLTLSTCHPFSYIGSAPDRYIIYAYPVE
ncbi:class D sortase [Pueribacillus theae]|uniref:Class D sortase n=1 Tax=Pueribacillus theae TaxID=2171751 RepID=A0A2U1JWT9_9BACI|nr:class D sortase [Pueribacillus theae]PWA09455.1 class D sortase [Pueribacillus theae]